MRLIYGVIAMIVMMSGSALSQSRTWNRFQRPEVSGNQSWGVALDHANRLWAILGGYVGDINSYSVDCFDGGQWRTVSASDDFPFSRADRLNDIVVGRDGRIWVSGIQGIASFDGSRWTKYSVEDSLSSWREYQSLACDSSGNVWAATRIRRPIDTAAGGVIIVKITVELLSLRDGVWQTHMRGDDISREFFPGGFSSISVGPDGDVWAVAMQTESYRGGLYRFDGGSWHTADLETYWMTSYPKVPSSVAVSRSGKVWIGYNRSYGENFVYDGGLSCFGADGWKHYAAEHGLPGNDRGTGVQSLYPVDDTTIWIGLRAGLVRFQPAGAEALNVSRELGLDEWTMVNSVVDIAAEPGGIVWLATVGGLVRFQPAPASVREMKPVAGIGAALMPNPVGAGNEPLLTLQSDRAMEIMIELVDLLGSTLATGSIAIAEGGNSMRLPFSLAEYPCGSYFLRMHLHGEGISIPLRIER